MTIISNFKKQRKIKNRLALQSAIAALAGTVLINETASAQTDSTVDITTIKDIATAELQADGSLLLTTDMVRPTPFRKVASQHKGLNIL